jgi:DNA invertase Pin-like site-specific DNA recombinase
MTTTQKARVGTRAAGYLRVSTARDDMHAPEMYEQQIKGHAKGKHLKLGRVYADIDYSGRKGARSRPEFNAMLDDAEAGRFDVLIVPKLSRFGRSAKDNLIAFDRLDAAGVRMVFLDLDMDTNTAFGRMMRTLLSAMAEFESDRISDYWRETYRFNVRAGRPHPRAPLGYRYDERRKTYRIVGSEARVVRDIFERYVNGGEATHAIAREYRDYLSKQGVLGVLDNVCYAGVRRMDGELFEGNWKSIIDMPTFEAAQARRSVAKARSSNREGTGQAMLSGLLRCGVCDRPMARSGSVYTCPYRKPMGDCPGGTIRVEKAEREVSAAFLERVAEAFREHAARKGRSAMRSRLRGRQLDEGDDLDGDLRELDAKIARAAEAVLAAPGEGFTDAFRQQAEKLEQQRADLVEEVARRKVANLDGRREREAFEAMLEQVTDLGALFEKATDAERRTMLGLVVKQVRVVRTAGTGRGSRKSIEIDWSI